MTIDDRALFKRAQANAAGFGELFDAYYDRIYKYAYRRVGSRDIADDIAARVFEDALKNFEREVIVDALKNRRLQHNSLAFLLSYDIGNPVSVFVLLDFMATGTESMVPPPIPQMPSVFQRWQRSSIFRRRRTAGEADAASAGF